MGEERNISRNIYLANFYTFTRSLFTIKLLLNYLKAGSDKKKKKKENLRICTSIVYCSNRAWKTEMAKKRYRKSFTGADGMTL